jgi:hypothetical protein
MENIRKNSLEDLRTGRNESSAAYMDFVDKREYHANHVFAFYEGEDGKYYNKRIKDIIGEKLIHITAGNKKKVLRVMEIIKSKKEYQNVVTMFFVDRDMAFEMDEYSQKDLYVTPCYSIENLYVNTKCIGLILENEFGFNICDKDYIVYLNKFEEYYRIYCDLMLEFNALILLRKEKELDCEKVNISSIKTSNLVVIDIPEGVTRNPRYDEEINRLKSQLDVSDEDVEDAKQRILNYGLPCDVFRGKNQLDFLVKYIQILIDKKKEIFDKVPNCVSINPNQNRLSTLSMYAYTPKCLEEFIVSHKNRDLVLV